MVASQNFLGVLRGVDNATFRNYIGTKVGKVLRCERAYCLYLECTVPTSLHAHRNMCTL